MFFAVFDGHGGHEVSQLLGNEMFSQIKRTEEYAAGAYDAAVIPAALKMDDRMKELFKHKQYSPGSTANLALMVGKELYVAI